MYGHIIAIVSLIRLNRLHKRYFLSVPGIFASDPVLHSFVGTVCCEVTQPLTDKAGSVVPQPISFTSAPGVFVLFLACSVHSVGCRLLFLLRIFIGAGALVAPLHRLVRGRVLRLARSMLAPRGWFLFLWWWWILRFVVTTRTITQRFAFTTTTP